MMKVKAKRKFSSYIVDVCILLMCIIGITFFLWVLVGGLPTWLTSMRQSTEASDKLFLGGILIGIMWGVMGFVQMFLNGILNTINLWRIKNEPQGTI